MEELSVEDVKYLLNYYKQKASDLELTVVELQIRLNKATAQKVQAEPVDKKTK